MKSSIGRFVFAALLIEVLMLTGCATLGPVYQKVEKIPEGMGLIYIYRPSSLIGAGVSYDVKIGENTIITTLHNGGYYPYYVKPGETEFWAKTESKSSVTIDIKPLQTYYIKGTVGVGFLVGRPHLMVVSQDVAEQELIQCKLIPEKKE